MEIQIPLILFTTLLAWSAGIFGSQAILAAKGQGAKIQFPALVTSVIVLAVGGVAVLFHLAQPLHIFNGFGNPTSGITQELIAIVVLFVWMVVYFALYRRNEGKIPAWCAIIAIILAVVLCLVMGHSYCMAARPSWNSVLQILSVVAGGLVMGPATVAFIGSIVKDEASLAKQNLIGSIAGGVLMVVYLISTCFISGSLYYLSDYSFDPTEPNAALYNSSTPVGAFAGDALVPAIVTIIAVVIAIAAALLGWRKKDWKVPAAVIVVAGLVAAFALRVVFYATGIAMFNYPLG